jgi:TPP-dependent trihydroxycyclohexane-1,2-dione (THcHDO) dehydratase
MTTRLTVAQAVVRFLEAQYVERDGVQNPFFACSLRTGSECLASNQLA